MSTKFFAKGVLKNGMGMSSKNRHDSIEYAIAEARNMANSGKSSYVKFEIYSVTNEGADFWDDEPEELVLVDTI